MNVLVTTSKDKDRSVKKLAAFTLWLINTLRPTPAWGKPKTNIMINEVVSKTKSTIKIVNSGSKGIKGTTSAYAIANSLISKVKWCETQEAHGGYPLNPGLPTDLADFEKQLVAIVSAVEEEDLV